MNKGAKNITSEFNKGFKNWYFKAIKSTEKRKTMKFTLHLFNVNIIHI